MQRSNREKLIAQRVFAPAAPKDGGAPPLLKQINHGKQSILNGSWQPPNVEKVK
ncbi:MAG TPA: hypothetical protein VHD56_09970 [Tepidisphaeraceae bacterium]|nr:hypothetical protein [Tepidisphaeraceae bacterium]